MINQLLAALPVVTFILDLFALALLIYLKRFNTSLMLLACINIAAIGFLSSWLSTWLILRTLAPFFITFMLILGLFSPSSSLFGGLLATAFFSLLSFFAIHSSSFLQSAMQLNANWIFAVNFLLLCILCAYYKSARFLLLYLASIYQAFFKDLFTFGYCSLCGIVVLIFCIADRRANE